MRVLVAFDKFKDALTAQNACQIAAAALRECRPEWTVDCCPLADGGEGFVDVLTEAVCGEHQTIQVMGPRGWLVDAQIGWVAEENIPARARQLLEAAARDTGTSRSRYVAVIEMAQASGLALLTPEQRDPWTTTSFGTGQMIRAAAEQGAAAIVLGVGGSATNDLGLGALTALGWSAMDAAGFRIARPTPDQWSGVHRLEGKVVALPPLRIACDVTNPLLGPTGATATYGPQKGLRAERVTDMEKRIAHMATRMEEHVRTRSDHRNTAGSGAAGGIAFGLLTAAGAQLVSGFDLVSAWCDLDERVQRADIVITGEGSFDQTSWAGKGPGAIAHHAVALGKQVHVFAGRVDARPESAMSLHAITPEGVPLDKALSAAEANLAATVRSVFA
jgi:glycerate 2-kinase